jgi:hypothetical protein
VSATIRLSHDRNVSYQVVWWPSVVIKHSLWFNGDYPSLPDSYKWQSDDILNEKSLVNQSVIEQMSMKWEIFENHLITSYES